MTAVLDTLLSISIGSLLTAGAIILVRLLFRRLLSPKAKYYLWLLLALRLVLPVLPESPTSLLNLLPDSPAVSSTYSVPEPATQIVSHAEGTTPASPLEAAEINHTVKAAPDASQTTSTFPWETLVFALWLSGTGITLGVYLVLYLLTCRNLNHLPLCQDGDTLRVFVRLKKALGIHKTIRLMSGSGGMSGGLIHPTIVIPAEQHGETLTPILLHELQHIRVHDLWLLAFYRMLCCLNWFNPVVWLCFRQASRDCEAACDQRVLETNLVEKREYAATLYRESLLSTRGSVYYRTSFGGNRHTIRRRISQISRFAGKKKWMVPLVLVLSLAVSACTLTEKSDATTASAPVPAVASEKDSTESLEEREPQTNSIIQAPELSDNALTFHGTNWGMSPEAVKSSLCLEADTPLISNGQNVHLTVDAPFPDFPEVTTVEFTFHYIDLDMNLGLDDITLTYDQDKITLEELLSTRQAQLGTPAKTDDSSISWQFSNTWDTISQGNWLKERIGTTARMDAAALIDNFDLEDYMASLQPPDAHFGWTYQQHVKQGLLLPEDGVLTELATGETSYETTITLGGYELAATYWFTPSILTLNLNTEPILREVYVDAPEGVPVSQWINSFISPYMIRMWQRDTNVYTSLITAGDLFTDPQFKTIQQTFVEAGYENQIPENWPLMTCWYDVGQFKFNATGYCLYQDAVNFLP